MKNVLIAVLGLVIMLTSFWGGAYFMHGNEDAWFHFPVFMTAFLGTVAGVSIAAYGFTNNSEEFSPKNPESEDFV